MSHCHSKEISHVVRLDCLYADRVRVPDPAQPSPIDLVVMNGANRYGFKGAFFTVMATNAASLVWIAAAGLPLAGAGSISETFLDTLTGVGGLYLVYYGWGMWRDAGRNITGHWMQAQAAQAPQSLRKIL